MVEEIGAIKKRKSKQAEEIAAAYATMLSTPATVNGTAQEGAGGGASLQKPDAIVLVGGRDANTEKAQQMRAAAADLRAASEKMKAAGNDAVVKSGPVRQEGEKQVKQGQELLKDARLAENDANFKLQDAGQISQDAAQVQAESDAARVQADETQARSQRVREQAELVIEVGESENSQVTIEQGMNLLGEAGALEGDAKIFYDKASGKSQRSRELGSSASFARKDGESAKSAAQGRVTSAEGVIGGGQSLIGQSDSQKRSGEHALSQAEDYTNRASLLESQADVYARMAAEIPFYVTPTA